MTDERELLLHYRPWLRKVAAGMTTPDRAELLAQEGWIAVWAAIKNYDGSAPLDWWLKRKAHGRMLTLVQVTWRSKKELQHVSTDDTAEIWDRLLVEMPEVELAYHHGQIAAALDVLTAREREYVVMRFWGGLNYPELTAHFGYGPQALWRTARPKLTKALAHLAVVA
jgi:RNA polymerase sigma factor (sigma-70 family)